MKNRNPGFPLLSGLGGFFSVSKSLSFAVVCIITEHRVNQVGITKKTATMQNRDGFFKILYP